MNSAPRRQFLVSLIAVGLGVGGWFMWPAWVTHATVATALPPRPDLTRLPPAFSELINNAEISARSYARPAQALAELAQLYHANAFYTQADQCYHGLMQLEPGNAHWPYLEATLLAGFGRLPEALPLLQRTTDLAPEYLPARLRAADALRKTDQRTAAAAVYKEVLQREPGNGYALLGLALCDLAGNDWNATREHLRQCIDAQPDFFGGWSLLVTVHEHFGDTELATTARRKAAAAKRYRDFPDPWLEELTDRCYDSYRLSVAAGGTSDRIFARRWLERAVALTPDRGSYHRQLGTILFQDKNYAAAQPHLENAVALAPDDGDGWALLVGLLAATENFAGAEKALIAGLAHCPQSGPLHYENGQRLRSMGQLRPAMNELETTKKLQPHDAKAYIELAQIYFQQGRTVEGTAELKSAVDAEPGNPAAVILLANYAIAKGDEFSARDWIRELNQFPAGSIPELNPILADFTKRFGQSP